MQLDDVELPPRLGRLALGRCVLVDVQLLADLLFLRGQEGVELLAGREPLLLLAEEDVVDREPPGDRVAAQGVGAQADAAALQGEERFLQGGKRAAEPVHRRPEMVRPSPGSNTASARPASSSWAFISSSVWT